MIADFLDREELAPELSRLLVDEARAGEIILVCGGEGVGKSALITKVLGTSNIDFEAIEIGHQSVTSFEHTSFPLSLATALGPRSRILGIPDLCGYREAMINKVRREDAAGAAVSAVAGLVRMGDVAKQAIEPKAAGPATRIRAALLTENPEELALLYLMDYWPASAPVIHVRDAHHLSRRDWFLLHQLTGRAARPQFVCEVRTDNDATPLDTG